MTRALATDELFHLSDPEVAAAATPDEAATEQVCHAIIDLITERGSLAPWELEELYWDHRGRRGWPLVAYYSIHRRASQMKRQIGVLRGTGERVARPGGKAAERLGLNGEPVALHAQIRRYMTNGGR